MVYSSKDEKSWTQQAVVIAIPSVAQVMTGIVVIPPIGLSCSVKIQRKCYEWDSSDHI